MCFPVYAQTDTLLQLLAQGQGILQPFFARSSTDFEAIHELTSLIDSIVSDSTLQTNQASIFGLNLSSLSNWLKSCSERTFIFGTFFVSIAETLLNSPSCS